MEKANEADAMQKSKIDFDELISDISDSETAETNTSDEQQSDKESFRQINIKMGERLTDDIIDAYCDKLQESVNKEVDGMLAMQYILLEPNSIKNLIKGDKNICQVIYDHCRVHYLVLFRNKYNPKRIIIYDPIVPRRNSVLETFNNSVRKQIFAMFGHLYEDDEMVEIAIETGLRTQNDSWSCGLRAVAFITHLLLGINPANYEYDLEKVGKFIMQIIKIDRPSRKVIANGQFGQKREDSKSRLTIIRLTKNGIFSNKNERFNLITKQSSSKTLLIGRKEINIRRNREKKLSKFIIDKNMDDSKSDNDSSGRKMNNYGCVNHINQGE
ncbi:hypothetical protein QQG55_45835 [Brugia pahangi]